MPTTPIVCPFLVDPVRLGLVASHNRPGGNVTGTMLTLDGLLGKQLQLIRDLSPDTGRVGILINMRNPASVSQQRDADAAAPALGIDIVPVDVGSSADIEKRSRVQQCSKQTSLTTVNSTASAIPQPLPVSTRGSFLSPVVSGEKFGEPGPRYSERHGCALLISTMVLRQFF